MLTPIPTQHALLEQLDQAVTHSRLQPEQCDLPSLLTLLLTAIAPLPLAQQLDIAGYVFEQLAGIVDERANRMLSAWESWHSTKAPVVNLSGDADLFVQSQQLDVADLFAAALPTPYPTQRQAPGVRGAAFESEQGEGEVTNSVDLQEWGALGRVLCAEAVDLEPSPLDETEMLTALQALSHGENIPQWSEKVSEAMQALTRKSAHKRRSLSLAALQQSLQMPLVEVWLALLLGDSGYQLTRQSSAELEDFNAWSEAFYSGGSLQVEAVE
ncbi:MAG: hypothetical protein RBJ76_04955 [Stenomitos frigidus ULC029]